MASWTSLIILADNVNELCVVSIKQVSHWTFWLWPTVLQLKWLLYYY